MARKPINTVTTFGNEERIDANFVELYSGTFSASANFSATCSAGTLIAAGTCAAAHFVGGDISGSSANFTATCSAAAVVATTFNGVTLDSAAWTTYTPTITAGTGTFTTVSGAGRFKQIGKTVFISVVVTITTNGSAAGFAIATLPVNAKAANTYILSGSERSSFGTQVQGVIDAVGRIAILNYDGTYPGSTGGVLVVSGVYEAA